MAGEWDVVDSQQPIGEWDVVKVPLSKRVAESMKQTPEQKRAASVMWNAAKGAVPAVADMLLNAPANAINLGNAAVGTVANMAGKPDLAPPLIEPPNYAQRLSEKLGFTNEQEAPQTQGERYLAAGSQGAASGAPYGPGGMALGALSGVVGEGVTQLTGNPAYGALAGTAVYPAANAVGGAARRGVVAAEKLKSQKTPMLNTLDEVRRAGYVVPPADSNPTFVNRLLTAIGGKTPTRQEASMRNEPTTANLVRKEIKAPADMPIDEAALANLADQRAKPYRDVADLGALPPPRTLSRINPSRNPYPLIGETPPVAAELLRDWKDANSKTKAYWKEYDRNNTVASQEKAVASKQRADMLAAKIEEAAVFHNKPELVDQLREARVDLAKIGSVERAANLDRGEVNALSLSAARHRGVPLTGELETIAKMGNAYPQAVQSPRQIGAPSGNTFASYLGTGIGGAVGSGAGFLSGGPVGASIGGAIGGITGASAPALARKILMSKMYQSNMTTPNYDVGAVTKTASKTPISQADIAALRGYLLMQQLQNQGE